MSVKAKAGDWSPTSKPRLARGVNILIDEPAPPTKDTWELALIEKTRRLDLNQPIPETNVVLRDDMNYDRPFRLNYTAAQTIAWLNGERTVAEVEQRIVDTFGGTPEQAQQTLQQVLGFLTSNHMLDSWKRRLRYSTFFINPIRLFRGIKYVVGYHAFHKYR